MPDSTDEGDSPSRDPLPLYSFKREEQTLVEGLMDALRSLLKRSDMTARQVYYTSIMLRALERMPCVTQGIGITLSLLNRPMGKNLGCQALTIDEESVRFTTWEYLDGPHGGDSQDLDNYEIGVGWRRVSADFIALEDWVAWFHRRAEGPAIEVSFDDFADSVIDWYDETDGSALWDTLDSDYT